MTKLQHSASLCERTVIKVSRENTKKKPRTRGASKRKASTKVLSQHWTDGVDPRVVEEIKAMKIPQVWRRIEVKSPTEVIIHNPGWKRPQ